MLNISEEVLAALVNNKVDPKEIVSRLAVHRPEVLLQMLHIEDLTFQVQEAYSSKPGEHNKVAAIKKYRELAGTGLKEAKLAVEAMISAGGVIELPPVPPPDDDDWASKLPKAGDDYDYSD